MAVTYRQIADTILHPHLQGRLGVAYTSPEAVFLRLPFHLRIEGAMRLQPQQRSTVHNTDRCPPVQMLQPVSLIDSKDIGTIAGLNGKDALPCVVLYGH
ncbi:hypothetical protein D3C75_954300 [compost metagenome]